MLFAEKPLKNILYIGVYKFQGEQYNLVNSYQSNIKIDNDIITNIIETSELSDDKLYAKQFGDELFKLLITSHNGAIFVLIVKDGYPECVINSLLYKLMLNHDTGKLDNQIILIFASRYDNFENIEKLNTVKTNIDFLKLDMIENIELSLQNCIELETLKTKVDLLIPTLFRRNRNRDRDITRPTITPKIIMGFSYLIVSFGMGFLFGFFIRN